MLGNLEVIMEELPENTGLTEMLSDALAATDRASQIGQLMLTYLGQATFRKELSTSPKPSANALMKCVPIYRIDLLCCFHHRLLV